MGDEGDRLYKIANELLTTERAYVNRLHLVDQVSAARHIKGNVVVASSFKRVDDCHTWRDTVGHLQIKHFSLRLLSFLTPVDQQGAVLKATAVRSPLHR